MENVNTIKIKMSVMHIQKTFLNHDIAYQLELANNCRYA